LEKYIEVDGHGFTRDNRTNYYLSSKKINGKRVRLHRYIWEKHHGGIPEGFAVHYIDGDRGNNDIDNLTLMRDERHKSLHSKAATNTDKWKETWKIIRQKGSDSHKRPEERAKQAARSKEQWEERKQGQPQTLTCKECGMDYETYHLGENMFCSRKCKARDFRRRFREEHGYGYDAKIRPDRKKGKPCEGDQGKSNQAFG